MAVKKYYHDIDLDGNQLISSVIENRTSAPATGTDGQVYYNTVDKKIYYYNALTAAWVAVGSGGGGTNITLTTTGTSGAATYNSGTGTLNIPNYQGLVPSGGTTGQILAKIDTTNYNTEWIDNYTSSVKHLVKLSTNMTIGTAVYVSSADGTNMIVSKASYTTEATSSKTLGLLAQGGVTNDQRFVITEGLLAGLDTSAATAGDPVWLGSNGALLFGLANKPVAPNHMVFLGIVTRVNVNNGEIFVKVQNGFEIEEIHDVLIQSKADKHILYWDNPTSLWKNASIPTVLGYTPENAANKGIANGYASLDSGGKVPASQLPSSLMEYKGVWNASTNTPTLANGTGDTGDVYRVSVAGTQNLGSGNITFDIGDYVIYNGSVWEKSDTTDAVASVNGQTGVVSLTTANISEVTNLYYTDARARAAISLTTTGTSGAATYNSSTGVLNIPQYSTGSGTVNTGAQFKAAYYPSAGTTVDDYVAVEFGNTNLNVKITAQAATDVVLELKAATSQSADILRVSSSTGTADLFKIGSGGNTVVYGTISAPHGGSSERFGALAAAAGSQATAAGYNASASGSESTAIGNATIANQQNATALGSNSQATGINSSAIGRSAVASATGSLAVGLNTTASGVEGTAIGQQSQATGQYSTAIGGGALAKVYSGVAIGRSATVDTGHTYSIAIGAGSTTTAANQLVIGNSTYGSIQDAYIGKGVVDAAPLSIVFNATGGTGTDIAAGNFVLAGGKGTGSGAGGKVILRTTNTGTTGTTLQTLFDRLTVENNSNRITLGYVSGTPADVTIVNAVATGTNITGTDLYLITGAGTGNSALKGGLIVQTPDATTSGTTVQSVTTKFEVTRTGQLKFNTYTSSSSYSGTAAGYLAFDSSGNIITVTAPTGGGSVSSVSVVSANGFAGTVANASSTPAITLTTTITGLLKGNGTAISAAVAGTDYLTTAVTTISFGTTGLTPNTATSGVVSVAGTLVAANGGTGQSSYTIGDLLYASASTTLSKLAAVAAGSYLRSAGVGTAPVWSTVTIPNAATLGDIWYGSAANAVSALAGNTTATKQFLSQTGNGTTSAAPAWSTIAGSDVTGAALTKTDDTNVTLTLGGTPGTSLLRAASLTLGWTGTLAVGRGGTGASTLTGVLIGNGTSAVTAVTGTGGQLLRRNAGDTAYEFFTPTYLTANQSITLSGDISGTGTTAITTTIGANKVTNAMLAQVATGSFLGRVTAATGNVETLTGTQATTLLDVFTSALKGLVPASGGGTTNFLRADGTWTTPGGGGSVTSVSVVSANGFAGTVATASSTPAITLTTTITGVLKGNGTAISAAVANTDYLAVASPAYTGTLTTGTLGFTPANPLMSLQSSVNGFNQFLIQNSSTGTSASSDIVVNNNQSTDSTFYGDFGINGSNYSGTGSFSLANAVYLYAASGDLSIGTFTSNAIHFVINNGASDAATIKTTGQLQLPGYTTTSSFSGTAAGYLAFDSSGNIITVTAPTGGSAYTVTNQTTTYNATATTGTLIVKCDTTGGAFTVNLPTAVGNTATIIIKKTAGSAALTVDAATTETIDGGLTATINKVYESITLISDNSNWQIV